MLLVGRYQKSRLYNIVKKRDIYLCHCSDIMYRGYRHANDNWVWQTEKCAVRQYTIDCKKVDNRAQKRRKFSWQNSCFSRWLFFVTGNRWGSLSLSLQERESKESAHGVERRASMLEAFLSCPLTSSIPGEQKNAFIDHMSLGPSKRIPLSCSFFFFLQDCVVQSPEWDSPYSWQKRTEHPHWYRTDTPK